MTAIKEAALQGEWFYLVEHEPLDRGNPEFFILRDGTVKSSTSADFVGEYVINDNGAVLTFAQRGRFKRTIALCPTIAVSNDTIDIFHADETCQIEALDEPTNFYGAFIRRNVDSLAPTT